MHFFADPGDKESTVKTTFDKSFILEVSKRGTPRAYRRGSAQYPKIRVAEKEEKIVVYPFRKDVYCGYIHLGYGRQVTDIMLEQRMEQVIREIETVLHNHHVTLVHQDELKKMFLSSVQTHAHTIEAKDRYTRGHVDRVDAYSGVTAHELGLTEKDKFELKVACILHDIGKIGVKERILNKPNPLTKNEMKEMMLHPVIGAEIVKDLYGFNISPIIKHHHERYDGMGYPDGLRGEAIPLGARIIAVSDAFDAMTTNRPYRRAMELEFALNELILYKSSQFDPLVVDAFISRKEKIRELHDRLISLDHVHISAFF